MRLVLAIGASDLVASRALLLVPVARLTRVGNVLGWNELETLTVAAISSIPCLVLNQFLAIPLYDILR